MIMKAKKTQCFRKMTCATFNQLKVYRATAQLENWTALRQKLSSVEFLNRTQRMRIPSAKNNDSVAIPAELFIKTNGLLLQLSNVLSYSTVRVY